VFGGSKSEPPRNFLDFCDASIWMTSGLAGRRANIFFAREQNRAPFAPTSPGSLFPIVIMRKSSRIFYKVQKKFLFKADIA
jgi:hypothetical protein